MLLPTEAECLPDDGASGSDDIDPSTGATNYKERAVNRVLQHQRGVGHQNQSILGGQEQLEHQRNEDLRRQLISRASTPEQRNQINQEVDQLQLDNGSSSQQIQTDVARSDAAAASQASADERDRQGNLNQVIGQTARQGFAILCKSLPKGAHMDQAGDLTETDITREGAGPSNSGASDDGGKASSSQSKHKFQKENNPVMIFLPGEDGLPPLPYKHVPDPWDIVLEVTYKIQEKVDSFLDQHVNHVEKAFNKWSSWWGGEK